MDTASLILIIVGALNWLSVGLFGFDAVSFLCGGQASIFSRIIYTIVGIAGIWGITMLFRNKVVTGKE